jgi:hypothetical protein
MRAFGVLIVLVGVGAGMLALNKTPPADSQSIRAASYIPMPPLPLLDPPTIKLGTLDSSYGMLQGSFTLTNVNKFAVADAEVTCEITAPSGTVVGNYHFTIFEVLAASKSKTVNNYKFGFWPQQGKSLRCNVQGAGRA